MDTCKIDIATETEILMYQMKYAKQNVPYGIIIPDLSIAQEGRCFLYQVRNYRKVFDTRVSREDLSRAEEQYEIVCKSLEDTLLDKDKVLFSKESIYRDQDGRILFLYYPASPVPTVLQEGVLDIPEQEYLEVKHESQGIKDMVVHVGFSIFAYCVFATVYNLSSWSALVAFFVYLVLCLGYRFWPKFTQIKKEEVIEENFLLEPVCFERPKEETHLQRKVGGKAQLVSLFDEAQKYDIWQESFCIGRNSNLVDLYISDPMVNPIHAEIILNEENFYIIDRCSRHGTYVNNTKIEPENPIPLYGTEEIRIGEEVFLFNIN